ncbi:MarR family transcriptional regulator [Enterococcus saccharolyticus]|uniref:MarR family transcriptional regulator n=1 Tax=Candidatus Enterococcus willemsii TaxID=1857215 RepID=A0ABQ6Z2G4_9ENTE|nr:MULTISPECIES: MarR family transcriptional regulator [Enterococcus]KAF1305516.1 MarR family transcriptional regulator [Enterococcus sp. CU12B]MCD5002726.1 MarR family transcriptional regulator [Enterococcus saccharolyticus]
METNELFKQFVEEFLKINNKLTQIQKKPVLITPDLQISTSLLHLIDAIGTYPRSTITEIAAKLGVTKGSISQQIPKLIQLGLVRIYQVEENKKNKQLVLTKKGESVNESHATLHDGLYSTIKQQLSHFTPEQQLVLLEILNKISFSIEEYQKKLTKGNEE